MLGLRFSTFRGALPLPLGGEGGVRQGQTRGGAEKILQARIRGTPPSSHPSPPKRGEKEQPPTNGKAEFVTRSLAAMTPQGFHQRMSKSTCRGP